MHSMRSLRSHGLTLLAVLVLLLGTAMPAMLRMTCLAGGHSVVSMGQVEDCCPKPDASTTSVSATCCELWEARPQRSEFVPALKAMVPMPVAVLHQQPVFVAPGPVPPAPTDAHIARPPPLSRDQRQAASGVYII